MTDQTKPADKLTDAELDEIEQLLLAATPLPWRCERGEVVHAYMFNGSETWDLICSAFAVGASDPENGPLVAAAVNALPRLIAEIRAARRTTADLTEHVRVVEAAYSHIEESDDGSFVDYDWSSGGGSKEGLWGRLGLLFTDASGNETRRSYTADDLAARSPAGAGWPSNGRDEQTVARIRELMATHGGDFWRCPQCDFQDNDAIETADLFIFIKEALEWHETGRIDGEPADPAHSFQLPEETAALFPAPRSPEDLSSALDKTDGQSDGDYVLVPRQPTEAMVEAVTDDWIEGIKEERGQRYSAMEVLLEDRAVVKIWSLMLASAPPPPNSDGDAK